MSAARKALRGASERHGEGVPRWRGRSYLSVSVKTEKHTLAFRKMRAARKALRGAAERHGEGVPPPLLFLRNTAFLSTLWLKLRPERTLLLDHRETKGQVDKNGVEVLEEGGGEGGEVSS
ncbi:unnamed protein product [Pleuronectes platessa]|uniref:Uncharacterized protein n=1 Tax=Pleuronectes platessa TaxID=8262 RepID=A0A9N7U4F7_PLEPL|nr:unnamed protein product [Pleuronectes platessa]